jgi:hypothetical protein
MVSAEDTGKKVFICGLGGTESLLDARIYTGFLEKVDGFFSIVKLDDEFGDDVHLDDVLYDMDVPASYGYKRIGFSPYRYEVMSREVFISLDKAAEYLRMLIGRYYLGVLFLYKQAVEGADERLLKGIYESGVRMMSFVTIWI